MQFLSKNKLEKMKCLTRVRKIVILTILFLSIQGFADCTITKHTYEVIGKHTKCTYTSYWRESSLGTSYRAESYNLQFSPECASFSKPLKGKKIKKELISNITGSDCPFESVTK